MKGLITMEKVLFVLNNNGRGLEIGGVQNVIMSIVRNLSDKYTFDILVFDNKECFYDREFKSYGGKIIKHFQSNKTNRLDYYIQFPRMFVVAKKNLTEHGPYKAIHCSNEYMSAPFLLAAKIKGVPIRIISSHTGPSIIKKNTITRIYNNFLRVIMNNYSNVKIGVSLQSRVHLFGNLKDSTTIYNAIDIDSIRSLSKKYSPNEKKLTLVQIGRFDKNKNQIFTLYILKSLLKRHPEASLKMIGFGNSDYTKLMLKTINKLKLEKNVEILPRDTIIAEELARSHYLVVPSYSEGFSLVTVEAQAVGIKCFVSKAIPSEINRGLCTFLNLSDGPEYWGNKIDSDFKRTFGKKKDVNLADFTFKSVMKKYEKVYDQVV